MNVTFKARLEPCGPKGAWTHMAIPLEVTRAFATKARVPVTGTLNGFKFRNSLLPVGDGTHYLNVNHELQAGAGVKPGELVEMKITRDAAPRVVAVPADLKAALAKTKPVAAMFSQMSYSHQKAFVDWIISAKKPETRGQRIAKTIAMVAAGERRE